MYKIQVQTHTLYIIYIFLRPHALEVPLVPVNDLQVMPDKLPPGMLARVGQQGGADHCLGCVSGSQGGVLGELTVL